LQQLEVHFEDRNGTTKQYNDNDDEAEEEEEEETQTLVLTLNQPPTKRQRNN
jgi:hypothetical protein